MSHFALLLIPTIQNTHGCRIKIDSMWMQMATSSITRFIQDFIDNTQTNKCVTWGHNIYTVLHDEMIIYYQKH